MYDIALFGFHILDTIPMARQTAIEQLQAGMLVLDPQGKIGSSNPAAHSILGSPTKRLQGWSKSSFCASCKKHSPMSGNTPAPSMWRLPSASRTDAFALPFRMMGRGSRTRPEHSRTPSSDPSSLIATNNYDYLWNWHTGQTEYPSAPGFERIDIDPNGWDCTKIWINAEHATTTSPRLSKKTGLIYMVSREYDAWKNVYVYYWAALDFRTGETVWKKMAGTGERFDSFYPGLAIGPNGALYAGVYGWIIEIKDTR